MALPQEKPCPDAGLRSWDGDVWYEWSRGKPAMPAPGPSSMHQAVLKEVRP